MINENKKEFLLEGLGCANCAAKMEDEINKLEGITRATISFVTKKLTIETKSKVDNKEILLKINDIVKKIESHVTVIEQSKSTGEKLFNKKELLCLSAGSLLFLTALIFKTDSWIRLLLYMVGYIIIGWKILYQAFKNILTGRVFDEKFLMAVATVSAIAIREYPEAVAVMLFYRVGELLESMAVNRSRISIQSLLDIRPDYANLIEGDDIKKIYPDEANIGSFIVVKPGERVPLDGEIIDGNAIIDTSVITGESIPRRVSKGDKIYSGSINKNGLLTIRVTRKFKESTVSRILELVENAISKKAKAEKFITKFAKYYTPAVVISAIAIALFPPILSEGEVFTDWIYRASIFLVLSCPCALVISIPLGFFAGIGAASRTGILVKGGNYLEELNNVDTIVFDKTGTLTKGIFSVTRIKATDDLSEDDILKYAAHLEANSNHPVAHSIRKAYGKKTDKNLIKEFEEIPGYGIRAVINDNEILLGSSKLMDSEEIECKECNQIGTVIHLAVNKKHKGYIVISDEIKNDSLDGLRGLKKMGIKKVIMLTGDNKSIAEEIAKNLEIDQVYPELLPHQKVEKLEMIQKRKDDKGKIMFVGDGINDAPALARADVGVAMGALGSDAAIESADIVLMTDEISKLADAVKIAGKTRRIVWQNILFSLAVKGIVLLLGAAGIATMWEAVFADVGVALIAILNSVRILNYNVR